MKTSLLCLCTAFLVLTGCSSSQFAGVATGSSLGGMFGSSVGGIFGGPRGHDLGGAIGMLAGGAAGAAATADRSKKRHSPDHSASQGYYDDEVSYGYTDRKANRQAPESPWNNLEVTHVKFTDENNNRQLDAGEHAVLIMDIYNRSDYTIYNIAPQVTCDSRRIAISPTAIVSALEAGQGFRYKAEVIASSRLKDDMLTFSVSFGEKKQRVTAKKFRIRTAR